MDCIIERCESGRCGNMIKPTLYRLPSDFKLRLKWCQQIARFNNQAIFVNDTDGKIRYICSEHFEESDFEDSTVFELHHQPAMLNNNNVRKLKPEAIPTKFFGFTNNQQSYLSKNLPNGYGYEFHPTTTNEVKYEHPYNATQDATVVTHFNQHYNNNLIDDNIYEEIAGDMVDEFNEEVVTAVGGVCGGIGSGDDEYEHRGGCFEEDSGSGAAGCVLGGVSVNDRTGVDHDQMHLPHLTHLPPQNSDQRIGHVEEGDIIDSTQQQFQMSHLISLDKSSIQHEPQQQLEKQTLPQSTDAPTISTTTTTTYVTEMIKPDSSNKDDLLLHSIAGLPKSELDQAATIQTEQLNYIDQEPPIDSLKLNSVEQLCHQILDEQRRFSDVMSLIKYACCDKTEFNPQIPTFNGYPLETNIAPDSQAINTFPPLALPPSTSTKINNSVCRLCLMVKQIMLKIDYVEMSNLYEKVTNKKLCKLSKDLSNVICLECINLLKNTTKTIDLLHKVDDYWCKMQDESIEYNKRINKTDEHEDDDGLTVLTTQPMKQNNSTATTISIPGAQSCDVFFDQSILEPDCYNGNEDVLNDFNYLIDFDNSSVVEVVEDIDLPTCDSGSINEKDDDNLDDGDVAENNYDHCYNYKPATNTTNVNNYEPARIKTPLRRNTICSDLFHERYHTDQTIINVKKAPTKASSPTPPTKIPSLSANSDDLFECDVCNDTFSAKLILDSHKLRHQYSMDQLFECERCQQFFPSQKSQAKHFDRVHNSTGDKKRWHRCTKCAEVFSSKHQLRRHDFLVHLSSKPIRRRTRCQSGIDFNNIGDSGNGGFFNSPMEYKIPIDWSKTQFNGTNASKGKRKISLPTATVQTSLSTQKRTRLQKTNQQNTIISSASFKCHLCINSCHKSLISLKDHFLKSHSGDWDEIVQTHCLQCPAVFDNIVELEEHRISDHNYQ